MLLENSQALETSAVICMLRMLQCYLQVLAGLKYAEAPGASLQHSSSQLGTNLVGNWGSAGQGCSTSVYPSSPNLVDNSRSDAGQSCSPSVQSSLPQGMPFGGTVQGSAEALGKAASLPLSPAAAPQQTLQQTPAALGTAAQRDRNASFGSPQQLLVSSYLQACPVRLGPHWQRVLSLTASPCPVTVRVPCLPQA